MPSQHFILLNSNTASEKVSVCVSAQSAQWQKEMMCMQGISQRIRPHFQLCCSPSLRILCRVHAQYVLEEIGLTISHHHIYMRGEIVKACTCTVCVCNSHLWRQFALRWEPVLKNFREFPQRKKNVFINKVNNTKY